MTDHVIQARVRRGQEGPPDKATQIATEVWSNAKISLLDQLKIEAAVLVPVLEKLRTELGKERADELVMSAVRGQRREVTRHIEGLAEGTTKERFAAFAADSLPRVGNDIDVDILRQDGTAFDMDVVGCRFAQLFHDLDEPELGAALVCECDDHAAEVIGPGLEYSRTQTIMKGATCCDFRYRIKDEN